MTKLATENAKPSKGRGRLRSLVGPIARWDLPRGEGASVGPMFALMLLPISASIAYAVELGGAMYFQRSMQNAADAAALAAAINNTGAAATGTTTQIEARAAAKPYGYVNGTGGVSVTAAGPVTCPTGTPGTSPVCYEAIVSGNFPLTFSRLIGFMGTGGTGNQLVSARAVATAGGGGGSEDVCVWSLSPNSNSFTSNGGPKPDMSGCSLLSNGGMTCNGHDLGADYGIAAGTSSGCGEDQVSGYVPPPDPYAKYATDNATQLSNAYNTTCGGAGGTYHQLTGNGNNVTVNAANQMGTGTGTPTLSGGTKVFCGDVQLKSNVSLTGDNTIIIVNGRLDLNGRTLSTASGASATIVYTGNNNATYKHYPISSVNNAGIIDIRAPTSGSWSGVAMYQDPAVTTNTSFTYAGNAPAWKISGLVYLPKADLTFSGIVNKASNGLSCFVLVSYSVLVNGTGTIFANTDCASSGLGTPSVTVGPSTRPKLVF